MMQYILIGFAPGLYWLWYFYKKDSLEPEPRKLVIRTYLLGIVVAALVITLQHPFRIPTWLGALVLAPLLEEGGKFLAVRFTIYRHQEFNEPLDGIIYAAAVALGFASLENALYVLWAGSSSQILFTNTTFLRALLSVPAHALFSSCWGYTLGQARFKQRKSNEIYILGGLLLAILLHSLFNLLCMIQIYSSLALLVLMVGMWSLVNRKIQKARVQSPLAVVAQDIH